jgi:integrase
LLAHIAKVGLSHNTLKHVKSFLSGVFSYALRQGVLNGVPNPMRDTSVPHGRDTADTYAYSLEEIQRMLMVLPEPAHIVVATAAYTGLRKGELRGMCWENLSDSELHVSQSVWCMHVNEPKTRKSKAPVPVIKPLANALAKHAMKQGNPEKGPVFRASNGAPLNLDNLVRRTIIPALQRCRVCLKAKADHDAKDHEFELDKTVPQWRGWHAFRRGLATNLHRLGVDDKTIQAILRHSNLSTTMNIYVKSVTEVQVEAMRRFEEACAKTVQSIN